MALQDTAARTEIENMVQRIEKIETAIEPRFQEEFVAAMAFPHRDDPYAELRSVISLPEPVAASGGRRRGRRRGNTPE
jgi:uncharacterized 2Fe-2S/4Fe-4S cluster protein (DUF4445 family)